MVSDMLVFLTVTQKGLRQNETISNKMKSTDELLVVNKLKIA